MLNTNPKLSGRAMQLVLHRAGIEAQKVTRKRQSGYYVADFYAPEMNQSIPKAHVWEQRLKSTFPGQLEVIDRHDTVATWRQGAPTISASVIFRFRGQYS